MSKFSGFRAVPASGFVVGEDPETNVFQWHRVDSGLARFESGRLEAYATKCGKKLGTTPRDKVPAGGSSCPDCG